MKDIVIIGAVRTPVGRYLGALKNVEAYDLASLVLNEVIKKANIQADLVDEVIMGQSYQSGEYVNIARMALLKAGWPEDIPGITIDRRCCTGLDVVRLAGALIQSEQAEIVIAGGVESMSNAEFYLPGNIKWGVGGSKGMPRGHGNLSIWGLPFYDRIQRARVMSQPEERYGTLPAMMSWAETAAKEEGITREACDQWALESHQKACAAISAGKFKDEIIPVSNEGSAEDYEFLLKWLLEDPTLGVVFKPKRSIDLFDRISRIDDLIKAGNETGRCHFLLSDTTVGNIYPAEAALIADLCIGKLLGMTAALEACLVGVPSILIDREGFKSQPFYKLGRDRVVFDNWESLREAVESYRSNPDLFPDIRDWSSVLKDFDPFQDGQAGLRMGYFIRWIYESLKQGKSKKDAIEIATDKFTCKWDAGHISYG